MRLLAIETSCDETAISIIEATGGLTAPTFKVLSEVTVTQLDLHKAYGGVVPMLAKREHQIALVPILLQALEQAGLRHSHKTPHSHWEAIEITLEREQELLLSMKEHLRDLPAPEIDAIAFTYGPGLEPALWVGVNFAKALAELWGKPLIPVNHMEGHLLSGLLEAPVTFPILGLLVSGGHTELVLAKDWCEYEILGKTRDDAVGEAFDKVARLLGLPYPGGPAISKLATEWTQETHGALAITLPRPMIHSVDLDFSFSGLKTSVLYLVRSLLPLTENYKIAFAKEFQDAAVDVLVSKTKRAVKEHGPTTFVLGGGVSANKELRRRMTVTFNGEFPQTKLIVPSFKMSTDNATMIGIAGYIRFQKFGATAASEIKATGNLSL